VLSEWVRDEMEGVDLHDRRLNERLKLILDQLGRRPTASIPAACGGHAEMAAAYRFFDNDHVGFEAVLEPHIEATRRRMAEQPVVLLTQDTTELDLTRPDRQVVGAGPMDGGDRRGVFLHPLMGFTPDGTPLGTLYAEAWTRADAPATPKAKRAQKRKHTPIEEKESVRWLDAYRQANREASELEATQFVCLADSEADIYELLEEAQAECGRVDWLIRACQDRALREEPSFAGETPALRDRLLSEGVLFTHTINVRGRGDAKTGCDDRRRRQPRQPRTAEVAVRAARVTLRAPWRHDRKLTDTPVNAVLVTEVNPPAADVPVEWVLLTSLPIDGVEEVRQVIQYYCVRWMIEVFFRTLKTGCRVEQRQFEHIDRFLPCLAVYLIVTWRTLYVCRLGREFPAISCEAVFEPDEWKSVYRVVREEWPPPEAPPLREMVRMVAQLGGYVNRSREDDPGPQTVWLGMQRLHDFAKCWRIFGPDARTQRTLV
jgi:hypothetical protein